MESQEFEMYFFVNKISRACQIVILKAPTQRLSDIA